jgi:glycosyltransferase involved in cell wall biosynthesis
MDAGGKKQAILMIIGCYHPEVGGNETMCRQVAAGLRQRGCSITILTEHRQGLPSRESIEGIPVYRYIKGWHLFEFSYMLSVLSFLIRNRKNFDAVFCFGLYLFTAPAVLFCKALGRKIFVELSSSGTTGDLFRIAQLRTGSFISRCARRADGVIAISRAIERELLHQGFSPRRIVRIPNGIDAARFTPAQHRPDSPFAICYVGRLAEGKGLEVLLQALKLLRERAVPFTAVIVGDGDLRASLLHQAEEHGLAGHLAFAGEVTDVVPYYQQSHVFVLPSFSEGMPLALLEAMACGACVVATPVGGIVDVIAEPDERMPVHEGCRIYRNGILVPPGDAATLAEALVLLHGDAAMRSRLCRSARATIQERYNLKRIVGQYHGLFSPGALPRPIAGAGSPCRR